ncbi:hypothetical protein PFFCH_04891 [Plasmodium falciparum FCH/4]|uniref:Peptide deformylase n=1 Tax=Plasmodium falciparum FCH/4 TaxID=1036724 RepID=A0A024VGF7_PLAFA|nr:hypothetical protein PFFCH_04891 [Plasmodium falciparum FCH/4]
MSPKNYSRRAVSKLLNCLSEEIEKQQPKNVIHFMVDFLCKNYGSHLRGFAHVWDVVEQSLVKLKLIEGCLSFPGIEGKVERPSIVSISYYDINGYKHLKILKGIHSRIFQHEFDHLNGTLFIDKMTQVDKKKVRPKLNELIRDYKATHSEEPAL